MTIATQTIEIKDLAIRLLPDPSVLEGFDSGEHEIDRNITKCCDWHGRYRNRTYCAFLPNNPQAVGFYCLGISATESKYIDRKIVNAHEAFGFVPFIYLNYIAVRSPLQGKGIGTILLMNLIERCAATIWNIGIYGIALNALNDRSAGLYDRLGFQTFGGNMRYPFMVLPAQSALDLFPPPSA